MKIDNFIDLIVQANLHLREGVKLYIEGRLDEFEYRLKLIRESEGKADSIRKDIESQLYIQTLIPESRGDVLGILESMDSIIDRAKSIMMDFSIEKPYLPDEIKNQFLELTEPVLKSVEELVSGVRAYFYEINSVKNHLHLVKFYEKDADTLTERILRQIFSMDIELSRKMHLRFFAKHIDLLADNAEDVANRLSIATIKRIS